MYLCRRLTGSTFLEIGEAFGRDYWTAIHACQQIAHRAASAADLAKSLEQLERRISREIGRRNLRRL